MTRTTALAAWCGSYRDYACSTVSITTLNLWSNYKRYYSSESIYARVSAVLHYGSNLIKTQK